MKVSNTLSTLACLALLSTYSVSGFAKTGNGDSYSGPTLSGAAVALTQDKPILNSQLTAVLKSCLIDGGNESYFSKVINPFYGNKLNFLESRTENDYFNKDTNEKNGDTSDLFTQLIFTGPEAVIVNPSKKELGARVTSKLFVNVRFGKDGVLSLKTAGAVNKVGLYSGNQRIATATQTEYEKISKLFVDRNLMINDMPIFSATVITADSFDPITGDLLKSDRLLKNLKMIYDRNEKAPYSPVINTTLVKPITTQIMAPNAELADCVSDQLGRL